MKENEIKGIAKAIVEMIQNDSVKEAAEHPVVLDLKEYVESNDEATFNAGVIALTSHIDKNHKSSEKIALLGKVVSGLEYHKSEHQKECPERKKNSFCQWENNYTEIVAFANKEKKRLILNQELMTFDEKIIAIFEELAVRDGRQGDLEEILKTCDIPYISNDLPEYKKYFEKTDFVNTSRISKSGYDISLNQSGLDYLRQKLKGKTNERLLQSETIIAKSTKLVENKEFNKNELEHPIVFISYSWDDEEHKEWVLKIANRLRNDGVDVILDRYHLRPGVNLSYFVENSLRTSNRIITILTPQYKNKADNRKGGVGQEYTIINNELIKNISNNDRIIPVLRKGSSESSVPDFLKTYIYVSFINDNEFDSNYEELLREIYKSPKIMLPKLGTKPLFITNEKTIEQVLPPIEHPKPDSKTNEIIKLAQSLTNSSYEERKQKVLEIYEVALNAPLSEVLKLIDDKNLDINIAAAISLKSITENLNIDLGTNPNVRQFVVSNLNNKSSFLRYRIFDYISVSEILQKDFNSEIERQLTFETNEEVTSKINSILGIKPVKAESNKQKIKTELQSLLMKNQLNEVFVSLTEHTMNSPTEIRNSVIMLSAQFAQLEKETMMGTISYSDVNLQRNRLMNSLISLVNEI